MTTGTAAQAERKFPDNFAFGASTAAYQIEGAWNADGKGPSIWDQFTHDHPDRIADGQNCDVGADSYHFYEEDIKAVKSLGVSYVTLGSFGVNSVLICISDESISFLHRLVTGAARR